MSLEWPHAQWIEDQLRNEPDALNYWLRHLSWQWHGQKRTRNLTREQMLAYCRNMAEQRARRVGHGTGAT